MFKTSSFASSSTILPLLIDAVDEDEVNRNKNGANETILLNLSASKRSTGASYPTFRGAKKGDGNTKKGVKTAKNSNYLTPDIKKTFNYLWHAFTQALIL